MLFSTQANIYHGKLDMLQNQMVSVARSTPVLFKVLSFASWANVQFRIRLRTFFIWRALRPQIKHCLCDKTCALHCIKRDTLYIVKSVLFISHIIYYRCNIIGKSYAGEAAEVSTSTVRKNCEKDIKRYY